MTRGIRRIFEALPQFIGQPFTILDVRKALNDPTLRGDSLITLARQGYIRQIGDIRYPNKTHIYEVTEVYPNEML